MNVIYHRICIPLLILWRMVSESTDCSGRSFLFLKKIWDLWYCVYLLHTPHSNFKVIHRNFINWIGIFQTPISVTLAILSSHCKQCHLVNTVHEQCVQQNIFLIHTDHLLVWFTERDWDLVSYASINDTKTVIQFVFTQRAHTSLCFGLWVIP